MHVCFKNLSKEDFLTVQWLGLCTGSIPWLGN